MNRFQIALIGNPNCGKTTIFNGLTGAHQTVGNWPGVTVEHKSGQYHFQDQNIEVIDLPGTYAIHANQATAIDERIACDYLFSNKADLIINIVDACHLERHLYLTTQLRELGLPILLVVNMMDVAKSEHCRVLLQQLELKLHCPVIGIQATQKNDVKRLREKIAEVLRVQPEIASLTIQYPEAIETAIVGWAKSACPPSSDGGHADFAHPTHPRTLSLRLLENDFLAESLVTPSLLAEIKTLQNKIQGSLNEDADILIADARYQFIDSIIKTCVSKDNQNQSTWTQRLDRIILHRVLGIPIFLAVMYALFVFAINIGGVFQDFFDLASNAIFIQGGAALLQHWHAPLVLISLFANGIGRGINTVVTFVPVIGAMFFAMSLLERSGYMARAAFVVDRLMRTIGLPGKAFVPLIVGLGCNVPAIMSARTLEQPRDRILTVLMTPFMSCGARLSIYAVFASVFFPRHGALAVFALYFTGILCAMLTGFVLRKTVLQGADTQSIMELPPYHWPTFKSLCLQAWHRLRIFLSRAGRFIIPICVLLALLNSWSLHHGFVLDANSDSLLAYIGRGLTPIFYPMGIQDDNWPATVGLLTGTLAKEVVIGTLNTLYSPTHVLLSQAQDFQLWASLQAAIMTIPAKIADLGSALINPIGATLKTQTINASSLQQLSKQFDGAIGAFAYLLFVLLYIPCVSTIAATAREVNWRWAGFSVLWNTGIAYGVAVLFYQSATLEIHPMKSIGFIALLFIIFTRTINRFGKIAK